MKKTVLYICVALLATMFQIAKDIYPTTKIILQNKLCIYEVQDIKMDMQKNDLLIYTNEEKLESFFVEIKNSYCHKNQ